MGACLPGLRLVSQPQEALESELCPCHGMGCFLSSSHPDPLAVS